MTERCPDGCEHEYSDDVIVIDGYLCGPECVVYERVEIRTCKRCGYRNYQWIGEITDEQPV